MYTIDNLKKYDYFKDIDFTYALDSLTGVLSRANILGFAKHLVKEKTPFMMAILDIDNFKLVNDNYGHAVGDKCLKFIASGLADYVKDDGLVGRFGGDEFVIISFKETTYDGMHEYIAKMFNEGNIVRRKVRIDGVCFYVTATVGCASFPKDCSNYDELFSIADKALYRGKTKGRNCYIIYVESKHKNLEVHVKGQSSLPTIYSKIDEFANDPNTSNDVKIKNILDYVNVSLQTSEAALLLPSLKLFTSGDGYKCMIDEECVKTFDELTKNNNIFIPGELANFMGNEKIATFVLDKKIITFMAVRVVVDKQTIGYLMLFEGKITRIWQEKDIALLLYLAKVIELLYLKNKNAI